MMPYYKSRSGYYRMQWKHGRNGGVACGPPEVHFSLISEGRHHTEWTPIRFVMEAGEPEDYQVNDNGWSLCSAKLRGILDRMASPADRYEWLPAVVVDPQGQEHDYYILHIPDPPDVLHLKKTLWRDKERTHLDVPVFARGKVARHSFFRARGGGIGLVVSESVKRAIQKDKCTGVTFGGAPVE